MRPTGVEDSEYSLFSLLGGRKEGQLLSFATPHLDTWQKEVYHVCVKVLNRRSSAGLEGVELDRRFPQKAAADGP